MQSCSVFLVEGGFPAAMPGLPPETISATFPFWGSHQVLDFAAANYRGLAGSRTILAEARFRIPAQLLGGADTVASLPAGLTEGLRDLLARLRSCATAKVLLAPVSQVCLLDTAALAEAVRALQTGRGIGKLTLSGSPTGLFLADRRS